MNMPARTTGRRIHAALLVLVLPLLLSACGSQQDDLAAYIERINERPGKELDELPDVAEYEQFVYQPADRRAPFVPVRPERRTTRVESGPRPDETRPRGPLEEFPLDALKMVGLVEISGRRFALVRDPDRRIHRVPVGTYAGQNHGRITAIAPREVQLVELVPDGFGGWAERPAQLPMDE